MAKPKENHVLDTNLKMNISFVNEKVLTIIYMHQRCNLNSNVIL